MEKHRPHQVKSCHDSLESLVKTRHKLHDVFQREQFLPSLVDVASLHVVLIIFNNWFIE